MKQAVQSRWGKLAGAMLLATLLLSCLISCNTKVFSRDVIFKQNLPYGPLPGERLDLCQPFEAPPSSGLPALILLHGGGWVLGNQLSMDSTCKYYATQGFVVAAINYRLAPQYTWPAQLNDAQLAVRWLRFHAHTLGLDTAKLCAYGSSAGAHLSIFLGELPTIHPGDTAKLLTSESPQVSCVVDQFGPTDLLTFLKTPYEQSITYALLGNHTPQNGQALYRDASPLFAVSAHTAPLLIIQGTKDTIVLPEQSRTLQTQLMHAGVSVQYISFTGGHAYLGTTIQTKSSIQQLILNYLLQHNSLT